MKSYGTRLSRSDKVFLALANVIVFAALLAVTYPMWFICIASVSDPTAIAQGKIGLLPVGFNLDGYRAVFENREIWTGYRNTIFYAAAGTLFSLCLTFTMGYALSFRGTPGKKLVTVFLTLPMFIGGGLIPYYLVMKSLGFINTIWSQIIPGGVGLWGIVITRTYIQTSIPFELREAAMIDGCGVARSFPAIILPLSKPIIAVMALNCAVGKWNSWFDAMIFLTDRSLFPLQLFMREILILNDTDKMLDMMGSRAAELYEAKLRAAALIQYAVIIVSTLPVIAAYPFLQKYFVKGVMIGAIKG